MFGRELAGDDPNDPAEPAVFGRIADPTGLAMADGRACVVDRSGSVSCVGTFNGGANLLAAPMPGARAHVEARGVSKVVGGSGMFCALRSGGGAYCFGGDGVWSRRFADAIDVTLEPSDADDPCVVRKSGAVDCWSVAEFTEPGTAGHRVAGVSDVVQVGGGGTLVCGVRRGGDVVCWDAPSMTVSSQYAPATTDASAVAVFDVGVCTLSRTGAVTCRNARPNPRAGQLRGATNERGNDYAVPLPEPATKLVSGGDHLCAMLRSGKVACWGDNHVGQAGVPSRFQATPALVMRTH